MSSNNNNKKERVIITKIRTMHWLPKGEVLLIILLMTFSPRNTDGGQAPQRGGQGQNTICSTSVQWATTSLVSTSTTIQWLLCRTTITTSVWQPVLPGLPATTSCWPAANSSYNQPPNFAHLQPLPDGHQPPQQAQQHPYNATPPPPQYCGYASPYTQYAPP